MFLIKNFASFYSAYIVVFEFYLYDMSCIHSIICWRSCWNLARLWNVQHVAS